MKQTTSKRSLHLGSALIGVICGGILVITFTKAIPIMLANIISGMMGMMNGYGLFCGPWRL